MNMVIFLFKFSKDPFDNKSVLVQIMAWYRIGDSALLSEPMTDTMNYIGHDDYYSKP